MELKLVYRALRKVSDWTVGGFYEECWVEGEENVPEDGPLIIASTHHNEIIDIATLAATIPHRRHLSFWAKSTMFANPIMGAILSSSGAIPVRRNPNGSSSPSALPSSSDSPTTSTHKRQKNGADLTRATLFAETSRALSRNQVVGVFPEGTSYTQPGIVQVMPGAAWAAVEYGRAEGRGETGLTIVPVAIVYTDKSRYRSRVHGPRRYGTPIHIDDYIPELYPNPTSTSEAEKDTDAVSKAAVKKIMVRVEGQMKAMTINAPDWDTICAVSVARSILWGDERRLALKDWVDVSQRSTVDELPQTQQTRELKLALTQYHALLQHTNTKHSILTSLVPLSPPTPLALVPTPRVTPTLPSLTLPLLLHLPRTLLTVTLSTPPLIMHIPAYLTGSLAARLLATPGEEEGRAQFKAVGGGVGLAGAVGGLQRVITYHKLIRAYIYPGTRGPPLSQAELEVYKRPLAPPKNPFIKSRVSSSASASPPLLAASSLESSISSISLTSSMTLSGSDSLSADPSPLPSPPPRFSTPIYQPPPPPSAAVQRHLIKSLIEVRAQACALLCTYLARDEMREMSDYLRERGANVYV
ncbi:hypothetical protein B0H34DRAFT_660490 [Crassisporium funariophilum]|nr:hypothetical protein B0H34DRAFT_660490 [Crassisporium funariophilum]